MLRRIACNILAVSVLFLGGAVFAEAEAPRTSTFRVEGMTCRLCEKAIEKSLRAVEGVQRVEVDRESKRVSIAAEAAIPTDRLEEAIETAGGNHAYEAQLVETK